MISVSGKNWEEIKLHKRLIDKLRYDYNLSHIVSKLVFSRNFTDEEIHSIKYSVKIKNPILRTDDFLLSCKILKNNIDKKNNILIIGDYDVDGCVSASLIVDFLNKNHVKSVFYIPDRIKDGYGASKKLITKLIDKNKPKLVIFLDCGSSAQEAIDYLNKINVESIIIDHHNIEKPYPKSSSLINPKKECNYQNLNYLCTAYLTYLFLDLYIKLNKLNITIKDNLIYVVLATVADVMPLRKINRYLSQNILNKYNVNDNFIISNIFKLKNLKKKIDINDLGYLIAPIINSAGRLDNADQVVTLLTTTNESVKLNILKKIFNLNQKRKIIEQRYLQKINLENFSKENGIIFFYEPNIPEGIIGILASKLKDYFNKPCVVLTSSGNLVKGSARSTSTFNIGEHISDAIKKKILLGGGGHNLAAGLLISKKNISLLKNFLNNIYKKKEVYEVNKFVAKISLSAINKKFFKDFNSIAPFGNLNLSPIFYIENVKILKPSIQNDKFISCFIKSNNKMIKSISFNPISSKISFYLLNFKKDINLITRVTENVWNNKSSIQLEIIDLIESSNNT